MVIRNKGNAGEYDKQKTEYTQKRVDLPKRRQWPKTDGFMTKADLPATIVLADEEPFVTKYEHYDTYKKRTFNCNSAWKDIDGKWTLDKSGCPYCQKGQAAKARVYAIVSFEDNDAEKFLLGMPVGAYAKILELYPGTTEWMGVVLQATVIDISIAGRNQKTIDFIKPDGATQATKVEAKASEPASAESPAEEPASDAKIDEKLLKDLVKKYKGLPSLGLGKEDIRTMIETALAKDSIDTAYAEKIMEAIY